MHKLKATLLLLALLATPVLAPAMPCHCFNDREFNPGEPAAADPYYLATAQNSFFAIVTGREKRDVVFEKQKPYATAEGMWITQWLSVKTGAEEKALRRARSKAASWEQALATLGLDALAADPEVAMLLRLATTDVSLASLVVDRELVIRGVIGADALSAARAAGAGDAEAILAAFLAVKTRRTAVDLLREVRTGGKTWGTWLLDSGMNGNEMVEEMRGLLVSGKK